MHFKSRKCTAGRLEASFKPWVVSYSPVVSLTAIIIVAMNVNICSTFIIVRHILEGFSKPRASQACQVVGKGPKLDLTYVRSTSARDLDSTSVSTRFARTLSTRLVRGREAHFVAFLTGYVPYLQGRLEFEGPSKSHATNGCPADNSAA